MQVTPEIWNILMIELGVVLTIATLIVGFFVIRKFQMKSPFYELGKQVAETYASETVTILRKFDALRKELLRRGFEIPKLTELREEEIPSILEEIDKKMEELGLAETTATKIAETSK